MRRRERLLLPVRNLRGFGSRRRFLARFNVHSDSDSPIAVAPGQAWALDGKLGWAVALAIGAAYLILFARLTSFPLQDYPNHVARGVVMADLLFQHGA